MNTTNTNPATLDEAIQALADMVFQFAYQTKYHGKPALWDGGLSALERAFEVLELAGCKMNANGTIQESNLTAFSDALLEKIMQKALPDTRRGFLFVKTASTLKPCKGFRPHCHGGTY